MSEESIIGPDGTLTIASNEVTWFTFLQVSRSTNSKRRGWNSKTHWHKKGLALLPTNLVPKGFLATWTTNSRHSKALPEPRKHTFQFSKRLKALKDRKRGDDDLPKENSENQINWKLSLWLHGQGKQIAYEVPLAAEKRGQLKVDLMVFHDGGRIEIIELKCSGEEKNPDSPLMALTEAICYAIQAERCWPNLAKEAEKQLGVKAFSSLKEIHLILAAPDYWSNCNPGKGEERRITGEQARALNAIVAAVGAELPDVKLSLSLADIGEDGLNLRPIKESQPHPPWSILSSPQR